MTIDAMPQWERDLHRVPKAFGAGWVMLAPECAGYECAAGAVGVSGLCGACFARFQRCGTLSIKGRWRDAHPERWEALEGLLR